MRLTVLKVGNSGKYVQTSSLSKNGEKNLQKTFTTFVVKCYISVLAKVVNVYGRLTALP